MPPGSFLRQCSAAGCNPPPRPSSVLSKTFTDGKILQEQIIFPYASHVLASCECLDRGKCIKCIFFFFPASLLQVISNCRAGNNNVQCKCTYKYETSVGFGKATATGISDMCS